LGLEELVALAQQARRETLARLVATHHLGQNYTHTEPVLPPVALAAVAAVFCRRGPPQWVVNLPWHQTFTVISAGPLGLQAV
jgi:hypothetical protein